MGYSLKTIKLNKNHHIIYYYILHIFYLLLAACFKPVTINSVTDYILYSSIEY